MTLPTATSRFANDSDRPEVVLGRGTLTITDVVALAEGRSYPGLPSDPMFGERIEASRRVFSEAVAADRPVYGVTTGVGASVGNEVPEMLRPAMAENLFRFHGVGTGALLGESESAAVLILRLATLARGKSAVRPVLLERLLDLAQRRVLPCIPEEGSVGASGDLTPLSYLAALVAGEREAWVDGEVLGSGAALAAAGIEPLVLAPKESLALMNGTAVMTAIACMAIERVEKLARVVAMVSAMTSDAIGGNPEHFDAGVMALKPHPGTVQAGAWISALLRYDDASAAPTPKRLQDRYSVRCAPQVLGVLLDGLASARNMIEIEINGVDDNPAADPDSGRVFHGGNFYGGHVCFAVDGLKTAVAGLADLLDRQLALLCVPETSGGLPENLVRAPEESAVAHHGFKAMQISASALTAEALKLTMPAASFSRSTESHNQDKVSMGTIAARDLRRIVDLGETVAAISVIAAAQAVDLREHRDGETALPAGVRQARDCIRAHVEPVYEDRRLDLDIAKVKSLIGEGLFDEFAERSES
jgi:histidine ammonia-lyase